jgi:hypothetical protein
MRKLNYVEANELIYRMCYEIEIIDNAGIVKTTHYVYHACRHT